MTANRQASKRFTPAVLLIAAYMLVAAPAVVAGEGPVSVDTWPPSLEVARVGRLYIAGQPDDEALETARENGISLVINLRAASEQEWDEAGAAESIGLQYHHVPVDGGAPVLEFSPLARITELVQANPDAQILVHCASGNRAAAWLAVYLAQTQGQNTEQVIATARQAGLTSEALEKKVRLLLEE